MDLNYTSDQMELRYVYRTFHPTAAECTFFSSAHSEFSRVDHMLDYEISLNKFKKIEIIPSIFFNHNAKKQEVSHRRKAGKVTNM